MKKLSIGFLQFVFLMLALLGLVFFVAARHTVTSEPLTPGIHTHEISYLRVIIHDSSSGSIQFETENHMLYAIPIVGAQPTALKPGQFVNLYMRQIFEVRGTEDEKNRLYSGSFVPCTVSTPCGLFLQAELLHKYDHDAPRNTLKVADPGVPIKLEWR